MELLTNTTEDSYCSDLWVNFTCKASDVNPPVSNYVLYEHNNFVASNNNGTWILKLPEEKKQYVYHCVAEQFVENVTSTNNVTIIVNGELAKVFLSSILRLPINVRAEVVKR